MTKLLQIMAGAKVGGAENFFMRLVPALHNAGHEEHVIIRTHKDRRDSLEKAGLSVTEARFGGPLDIWTPRKIKSLVKSFDPQICMAWMARAADMLPDSTGKPFTNVARLGGYYDLKYFKKCDHLIGNTKDICDYLIKEGWPSDKTWYLPNFVDDTAMPPVSRGEFETDLQSPVILCLGRLHENKGFDVAISAMKSVPDAILWIAGSGPEEDNLKALARELDIENRIRFLGWRNDVPALFAAADIFLCSSRHEPLGNMLIEAWAHSTPIVAMKSQGPLQLIKHGEEGLLTDMEDVYGMAEALNALIKDPGLALELAQNGNRAFRDQFTEGKIVEAYEDFFTKIGA